MPNNPGNIALERWFQWALDLSAWGERRGTLTRYLVAVALTALAVGARVVIADPVAGSPFITLFPAALFTTLIAGFGPGMLAAVLGLIATIVMFVPPYFSLSETWAAEHLGIYFFYLLEQFVFCSSVAVFHLQNHKHREAIAELKRSEDTRDATSRLFRATFEHAAVGIAHLSRSGHWLRINRHLCQILGYDRDELLTLRFHDITYPPDLDRDLNLFQQTLDGHISTYSIEKRYIHKKGHIVWGALTVALMRTPEGAPDYFISVVQDITERKLAEATIRDKEQQLGIIARHIPGGLARVDKDLRYSFVSEAYERFYRRPVADIVGKSMMEILGPVTGAVAIEHARLALQGQANTYENHVFSPTGQDIWVEVASVPEVANDGSVNGLINVITFITARKKAEQALVQSQNTLLRAQAMANLASWTYEIDARTLHLNEGGLRVFGVSQQSISADEIATLVHPADIEGMRASWRHALLSGADYSLEFRVIDGGQVRWLYTQAEIICNEAGRAVRAFGITQDITQRKQSEQKLRDDEWLLAHANSMADLLSWTFNPATGIYNSPGNQSQIFGPSITTLTLAQFMQMLHPDDREQLLDVWNKAYKGLSPYNLEYRAIVNGELRWHHSRAEFVRDPDSKVLHVLGVTQDITERKKAEAEIRKLNNELEQRIVERTNELREANAELESFAYAVAHDLRAPLRTMNGFSQALLDESVDKLDESMQADLARIVEASKKMGRLIDGLLQLSRHTRSELLRKPVDLSRMAGQILLALQRSSPGRHVHWQVEEGMVAHADENLIDPLLTNLLSNAWKYTSRTPDARIEFYSTEEKGQRFYCIRDNGAGFSMSHAGKLFQPFQRLHRQDDFPGLGIGLATALRIVRRHGGELRANAQPDQGAVFSFSLPATALPALPAPAPL